MVRINCSTNNLVVGVWRRLNSLWPIERRTAHDRSPTVCLLPARRRSRVGQPREILFEFSSTFAIALAVSEAYPTTELAASGVTSLFKKNVYMAHVTMQVPALFQNVTSGEPITQSTFILRRITNPVLNWWLQTYEIDDKHDLLKVQSFGKRQYLSFTCMLNTGNRHVHKTCVSIKETRV